MVRPVKLSWVEIKYLYQFGSLKGLYEDEALGLRPGLWIDCRHYPLHKAYGCQHIFLSMVLLTHVSQKSIRNTDKTLKHDHLDFTYERLQNPCPFFER